jgi:hypothetical protein
MRNCFKYSDVYLWDVSIEIILGLSRTDDEFTRRALLMFYEKIIIVIFIIKMLLGYRSTKHVLDIERIFGEKNIFLYTYRKVH